MPDDQRLDDKQRAEPVAGQALRSDAPFASHAVLWEMIDRLISAATAADHRACLDLAHTMMAHGIPAETIGDVCVPQAARVLGEMWCSDERSFAEVTIGVSRLQAMLHSLGPAWIEDQERSARAGTILLLVAHEQYHTLGALVLAGQLRRRGYSVRLMLGARPGDVGARLQQAAYDVVFISASRGDNLERLRKIVEAIRKGPTPDCPVVLGGTLLETQPDAAALIGADFSTSSPDEALALCQLDCKQHLTDDPARGR